jgi:peptide/nickel transport system permease protein
VTGMMDEKTRKKLVKRSEKGAHAKSQKAHDYVEGPWSLAWKRFKTNKLALIGLGIFIVLAILVIFAGVLTPYDYKTINVRGVKLPPSLDHLLGTDKVGRDNFTRLLYGGRVSLLVGIVSVSISVTIGVVVGGVAGYYGGVIDTILMRFAEIVYSFPFIPLILTLSYALSSSGKAVTSEKKLFLIMVLIGLLSWPGLARLVRGQILSLREQEFMLAATALGVSDFNKVFKHLIPNTLGYIIVYATLGMASAILTESALSFLGLGVVPPTPSWGNMIQEFIQDTHIFKNMPWLWVPPGVAIMLAVVSINLVGEGLRAAFDPKSLR